MMWGYPHDLGNLHCKIASTIKGPFGMLTFCKPRGLGFQTSIPILSEGCARDIPMTGMTSPLTQWLTDLCSSGTSAHGETMCIPVFLILLHVLHHLNTTWSSKHPSCHIHLVENRLGMGHCGHLWNVGSRLPTAGFKRDQRRKTPRGRQLISDNLPWKSGQAAAFGPIFGAFNFFSQAACSCTVDKCCKIFESFKTPSSARWAW